ncbi:hypothetical protein [Sulfurimonas sp.]|uniref:hypothetical protein n=1 Tax=Sulfurimonas sp. TaxID=2022749 RepID=UPI0025DBA651|nr:hypothetical protein [Sulfurimonas sp.]
MKNYEKINSFITILTNKQDFLNSYSREIYTSNRYNYPISSLTVFIPENITTKKIKIFIIDSFRGSDIVYCNHSKQYIQVLLPFTPQEHLDIIIDRMTKEYDSIKQITINRELIFEKVDLSKNTDEIISVISTLEKADENANIGIKFNQILKKILTIVSNESINLNFINYYCGMKISNKAILVNVDDGLYTFSTDSLQIAAINNSSSTIIQIKKYGYSISAKIHNIDYVSNKITLKDLFVMQYNNIYPASLTVELKKPLNAKLISLGSDADIKISAISFNEIHGYGDISNLMIDNNTLRILIQKDSKKYTLLVKFIHSRFDGETQRFILSNLDNSNKSIYLFQDLVTQRSRECIQELKQFIA